MSSNKAREETSKTVMDQGVGCNLDKELSPHDIEFLSKLRLSEEQLKLKETDVQAFWKSVSQSVAAELSDSLEDNRDLYRLKELMEEESRDLTKSNIKLENVLRETREICKALME